MELSLTCWESDRQLSAEPENTWICPNQSECQLDEEQRE